MRTVTEMGRDETGAFDVPLRSEFIVNDEIDRL
jgi:hypothetical protein